jgi:hypothetical protein
MAFSVWECDWCLSWDDTVAFCSDVGVGMVPVLFRDEFDARKLRNFDYRASRCGIDAEGYVVRNEQAFRMEDFGDNVAKFVRLNHVKTDQHWKNGPLRKNKTI